MSDIATLPAAQESQILSPPSLSDLITKARTAHAALMTEAHTAETALSKALDHAITAGRAFNEMKDRKLVKHGEWAATYKEADVGEREVERYRQLARFADANPTRVSELTGLSIRAALERLTNKTLPPKSMVEMPTGGMPEEPAQDAVEHEPAQEAVEHEPAQGTVEHARNDAHAGNGADPEASAQEMRERFEAWESSDQDEHEPEEPQAANGSGNGEDGIELESKPDKLEVPPKPDTSAPFWALIESIDTFLDFAKEKQSAWETAKTLTGTKKKEIGGYQRDVCAALKKLRAELAKCANETKPKTKPIAKWISTSAGVDAALKDWADRSTEELGSLVLEIRRAAGRGLHLSEKQWRTTHKILDEVAARNKTAAALETAT
jgi:hypothetical protein